MKEAGKAWAEADPAAALDYARSLNSDMGAKLAETVMTEWAGTDPDAAAEFAAAQTDAAFRAKIGEGLVEGLAENDPQGALAWAQENLQSAARAKAIGSLVKTIAEKDVAEAADIVGAMDLGGAMNQAVKSLIDVWAKDGLKGKNEVFTWIDGIEDVAAREQAVNAIQGRLEFDDPNGIVKFVAGDFGHLAHDHMIQRAAVVKVRQDPESAIARAKQLPEDRSPVALKEVLSTWQRLRPEEAKRWEAAQQ